MLLQVLCLSLVISGVVGNEDLQNSLEEDEIHIIKKLPEVEKEILNIFNNTVKLCREELKVLRNYVNRIKAEHANVTGDAEEYLANPINAYSLIKRMTLDWLDLKTALQELNGVKYLKQEMAILRENWQLPNIYDYTEAAKAVINLQVSNSLQASDLVQGIIDGKDYGDTLDWHDCFELGRLAYENRELSAAREWFLAFFNKLEEMEKDSQKAFELSATEYLALIDYEFGDNESALKRIDSILAEYPEHPVKNTKTYILLNEKSDFFEENES